MSDNKEIENQVVESNTQENPSLLYDLDHDQPIQLRFQASKDNTHESELSDVLTQKDVSGRQDDDAETPFGGPVRYHCDFCQKDISDAFRVKCVECADFDLCVDCFTSGVETGSHKNSHRYAPIGRNTFSLFTEDWNADEEMMLLEGVSKFGFGNWTEVADLISTYNSIPKTKEQCESHYYDVHITPFLVKPQQNPLSAWFGPSGIPDMSNQEHRNILQDQIIGPYHRPVPKPLLGSLTNASCKVVGFMPLRGDFDVEYDNDAELLLSDIEFRGDETPQERELKLKVLDIYNAKLDERFLRKRIIIERGLADWRKNQQNGKKKSKEEVDLRNLFGLLLRFDIPVDPDELVQLILSERMLRRRLDILQEWQSLGLQSYEDVQEYEKTKLVTMNKLPVNEGMRLDLIPKVVPSHNDHDSPHYAKLLSSNQSGSQQAKEHTSSLSEVSQPKSMSLEAPASQYPGSELLTEKELEFCNQIQLPPVYFLFTKYILINAMMNQEGSATIAALESLQLDAVKIGSVYDFIVHSELESACNFDTLTHNMDETGSHQEATRGKPFSHPTSTHSAVQRQRVRRRPLYVEEMEDTGSTSMTISTPSQSHLKTKNQAYPLLHESN